jgi:hypothetical protein
VRCYPAYKVVGDADIVADEAYLPPLTLPTFETPSEAGTTGNASVHPSNLLSDATKLTMVLEAGEDVVYAERALREIDNLRERGVEGSGELECQCHWATRDTMIMADLNTSCDQ